MDGQQKKIGKVLEIIRMSTEDGPGIRTTVFLKGCTLACKWCHNPESISPKPELQWIGLRCIACKMCLENCEQQALSFDDSGLRIDRNLCIGCGKCAEECPSTALELMGADWSVDELVNELAKDKAYFDKSGGGVTMSGGEATMQSDFVTQVFMKLKKNGISTALDTCGKCKQSSLEKILPFTDLVLYDLKVISSKEHIEYTGYSNEQILLNVKFVEEYINAHLYPQKFWIRTPIIPGATDNEKTISEIGNFIAENLHGAVERWELCTFNNLCKDKYQRLGIKWEYENTVLLKAEQMEQLSLVAKESGVDPKIVKWSGTTALIDAEQV